MGSHQQTLMMKTLLVLLMITALVSANPRNQKHGKKGKGENVKREGRHEGEHVKVQRVWHVAESEEQCGDEAAEIHQHDVKPHELCSEVNTTISICVTRDTEVVEDESEVEEAAETNEVAVDGETEEEAEVEFAPKEGAEWEFRTGTCAFRLIMENDDEDEERSQIVKKNKKKQMKKKKKPSKAEKKRMQDRAKMRRKMKAKDNNKKENTKSRARRVRNKNNKNKNK